MRRICYLGPPGTFSEEAALEVFGSSEELIPLSRVSEVFEEVSRGFCEYGVVPVENSLEGGVGETLDELARTELRVCCEVQLKIELVLAARPGTRLEDVNLVLSHPKALAQCKGLLSRLGLRCEACASTAEALRRALEIEGSAALASRRAAELLGADVILERVQDEPEDYTRFFVVGHRRLPVGPPYKTSLVMWLPHVPGSLYRALEPLARRRINLTRIESRPVRGRPWEYFFHVDFEGDAEADEEIAAALEELASIARVKLLGSYGVILPSRGSDKR
ncbi:MAG: prephenate dehydratase [Fervidicoccaceae archaeon]